MRIPRTRGAVSGTALMILGAWGALIPLIGPYFNWVIGADKAWQLTTPRLWLSVVPGVVAFVGGLILTSSAHRARAGLGAWLGILSGAWFVVGEQVSQLWNHGATWSGTALGGSTKRVFEHLTYFDALGALILLFGALALGRLAVRSVRDEELQREAELEAAREERGTDDRPRPRRTRESGRFDRDEPVATGATGDVALNEGTTTRSPAPPATDGVHTPTTDTGSEDRTTRNDTLSAADRVREASDQPRRRGGLFRRGG